MSDETRLILYALEQQASVGPCSVKSKWGMSTTDRAKYETWMNLGKMETFEAMRLFVKLLDEENKEWWNIKDEGGVGGDESRNVNGTEETKITPPIQSPIRRHMSKQSANDSFESRYDALPKALRDIQHTNRWVEVASRSATEDKPHPRYQHACTIYKNEMIILGGTNAKGRHLGDMWSLNLSTLTWQVIDSTNLLPTSGARLVVIANALYLVGGNVEISKEQKKHLEDELSDSDDEDDDFLQISRIEFSSDNIQATFTRVVTKQSDKTGRPRNRRGHTASVLNNQLILFGGEEMGRKGRYLNDCKLLDLKTSTWRTIYEGKSSGGFINSFFGLNNTSKDSNAPLPRTEHVAIAFMAENNTVSDEPSTSEITSMTKQSEPRFTLLVFGGTGASHKCFDDLFALDVSTGKWTNLSQTGVGSTGDPRAGHCGVLIDASNHLMIIGGGNNERVAPDAVALNLQNMRWESSAKFAAPKNSGEGMSLTCVHNMSGDTALIAFGGYDGQCQNNLHVCVFGGNGQGLGGGIGEEKGEPRTKMGNERSELVETQSMRGSEETTLEAPLNPEPLPLKPKRSLFGKEAVENSVDVGTNSDMDSSPNKVHASSGVDALAADNLRLRSENAYLISELARARSREAELTETLSKLQAKVASWQTKGLIEEEEEEEEEPERRGWLFGL